jgi:hypothetical protein
MLIGNDPYQFEVIDTFGHLPVNVKLGYTHGICVDTKDNVYVFNQSPTAVVLFDRHGAYQRSWGEEFRLGAHGMRLTDEEHHEFLYLTDYERHDVTKTSRRGEMQFRLKMPPRRDIYGSPSEFKPTDVCVAPNSDIYVFDGYGKPYVHVYDYVGKYKGSIGGPGKGEGQLDCPHGGWIDTRRVEPELYVADRGNSRIQVFSLEGKFRRIISDPAIKQPCGFYQFFDEMWVPDLQARLVLLDKHDKVAAVLGDNPEAPTTPGWPNIQDKLVPGKFNSPHACCVDTYGDVYVAEWISTGRITKLVRKSALAENAHLKPGRLDTPATQSAEAR